MKKITITIMLATSIVFGTDISGDVSGTWSIDDSPYYVVGNTTVSSGATLTIEPGTLGCFFSGNAVACRPQAGSERVIITTTGPLRLHTNGEELKTFATQVGLNY